MGLADDGDQPYKDNPMSPLYTVEDGWIETYTGQAFHFLNPHPSEVHLQDIAHSLAMQARYNGHTKFFYSVAEHSVLMAIWLLEMGYTARVALTGLLHDAAETYIGDLARPVKEKIPDFKVIERRIDIAVSVRFNTYNPFPPVIKEADTRILVDERFQAMNPSSNKWGTDDMVALGVRIEGWSPQEAKINFLETYIKLTSLMSAEERPHA